MRRNEMIASLQLSIETKYSSQIHSCHTFAFSSAARAFCSSARALSSAESCAALALASVAILRNAKKSREREREIVRNHPWRVFANRFQNLILPAALAASSFLAAAAFSASAFFSAAARSLAFFSVSRQSKN